MPRYTGKDWFKNWHPSDQPMWALFLGGAQISTSMSVPPSVEGAIDLLVDLAEEEEREGRDLPAMVHRALVRDLRAGRIAGYIEPSRFPPGLYASEEGLRWRLVQKYRN